ncbi:phosphatase PAP2 family protein [Azospirillum picis]|uniref:Undecaprenyl-diphosphatase n=1 Tax=Azospirillum picis TaxID=488438 RepID=A0ABU0MHZ0_9PROT|nr:phosphatase PAP2 family protein [Azospirillum picis]MBP2299285.1 undecaprenyl-diphosphatase [Azospirillum picis]MDQ0533077.1 undecaprenyl-diphosphatase [Azospirillum picis]
MSDITIENGRHGRHDHHDDGSEADGRGAENRGIENAGGGIGYGARPAPALLQPALAAIDTLDSQVHDTVTCNPGAVSRALAIAGHYAIKRHILIPGFATAGILGLLLDQADLRRAGSVGVAGLVATAAASRSIKRYVKRRRPDECAPRLKPGYRISARSLPSGHAASAFAAATALASVSTSPVQSALIYGGAVALASGRVVRHRHWASDVVAGALLGTAVTLLARSLLPR